MDLSKCTLSQLQHARKEDLVRILLQMKEQKGEVESMLQQTLSIARQSWVPTATRIVFENMINVFQTKHVNRRR